MKIIFKVELYENDEYIITINREDNGYLGSEPIGIALSYKDAVIVQNWLMHSIQELLGSIESMMWDMSKDQKKYLQEG